VAVARAATPDTIVISNFAYGPLSLTVAPGTKITVMNKDQAPHTVTANDKSFDTGTIFGGQQGEMTAPTKPGTYPYTCTIHQYMTGTLIVK
jgi:plastocyanin